MNLPSFSVNKPITVLMILISALTIGYVALTRLPVELSPNISYGDISIIISVRGGMPPAEVETLVTKPVEEAVSTVSYLENIYSTSKAGESRVSLEFEPGTDMNFATLEVREKFSRVREKLPKEIEKPIIAQYKESDRPVYLLAISGQGYTTEALRRIVDEQMKERILRVEGVANVEVYGGRERKILVEINKDKLNKYMIPIDLVVNALGSNNLNLVGGDIERNVNKILIRIIGEFKTVQDIKNIGVIATPQGFIVRLGEIAEVKDDYLEPTSYARTDIEPVVSVSIQKASTANTLEVVSKIKKEIELLRKNMDKRILIKTTMDQALIIQEAIKSVKDSLMQGAFLAAAVLLLFLRDVKLTSIIAVTIPASLMTTFILMYFFNITVNVMTLSGLSLGVGMFIDNSIVVLDNIDKKRSGVDFSKPDWMKQYRDAIVKGAAEMELAIVASTITNVIVFLPFVFVNKETQMLWGGLSLTITFSLFSSLFFALTIIPMLSNAMRALPKVKKKRTAGLLKNISSFIEKFNVFPVYYRKLLELSIRFRYICVLAAFGSLVLAMILGSGIQKEFMAEAEEGRFTIFAELEPGAKLDVTDKMVKELEAFIINIKEIKTFSSRIEPWSSKLYVKLVPLAERGRSTKEIMDQIRSSAEAIQQKYKGGFIYFSDIQEKGLKEIVLDLYGYEYEPLKETAVSIATRLGSIPGFQDIRMSRISGRPEWAIAVDRKRAAFFGLTVKEVADVIHSQTRGLRATLFRTESREVETISRIRKEDRDKIDDLRRLPLFSKDGQPIIVEQVADFIPQIGSSEIVRKSKMRVVHITSMITNMSLIDAVSKVDASLKDMEFPKDYYYRIGGTFEKDMKNEKELTGFPFGVLWLTLFLVYLVLACLFESYVQPFIIMISVPLATIGIVLALMITHKPISKGVLLGAIMLAGIVVNNAIVLIDKINFLRKEKEEKGEKDYDLMKVIVEAGEDRLRPISMTTSSAMIGLVPMAFDKSESANLWSPLAIAVIGGMFSSTILTLFIMPGIYLIAEELKDVVLKPKLLILFVQNKIYGIINKDMPYTAK